MPLKHENTGADRWSSDERSGRSSRAYALAAKIKRAAYARVLELTQPGPEQRFLEGRLANLTGSAERSEP